MNLVWLALAILVSAFCSGALGAMLGLGGGAFLIPLLTLVLGIDVRLAIGTSMVAIVATALGMAVSRLRDPLTNTRVGVLLLLGATAGSVTGAVLAGRVAERWLYVLFGVLMAYSAFAMLGRRRTGAAVAAAEKGDALAQRWRLGGAYFDPALGREVSYQPTRTLTGTVAMYFTGLIGGLLGIGAGALKVLVLVRVLSLPLKVSAATSNFLNGMAAAAAAAIFFARGQIDPSITGPAALGVLAGAFCGSRLLVRLSPATLQWIFVPVLFWVAAQMIWKGIAT